MFFNNKKETAIEALDEAVKLLNNLKDPEKVAKYFVQVVRTLRDFGEDRVVIKYVPKIIEALEKASGPKELLLRLRVEELKSKLSLGLATEDDFFRLHNDFIKLSEESKDATLFLSFLVAIFGPYYEAKGELEFLRDTLNEAMNFIDKLYPRGAPPHVLPYIAEALAYLGEVELKLGNLNGAIERFEQALKVYKGVGMEKEVEAIKRILEDIQKKGNKTT